MQAESSPEVKSLIDIDYFPVQQQAAESQADILFFGGAAGGSKAQSLSAKIMTPFGWKTMGEMSVNDQVCNPDGSVARVIGVFDHPVKPVYRVKFIDGAETLASEDHLWLYWQASKKIKADRRYFPFADDDYIRAKLTTTAELKKILDKQADLNAHSERAYWPLIPLADPVAFTRPRHTLHGDTRPIDPYILGILIGDGGLTKSTPVLTTRDDFIIQQVASRFEIQQQDDISYRILSDGDLRKHLTVLNLYGKKSDEKFIPESYLYADVETRFALMQGLMDTDGSVDVRGHTSYTTISKQLANNFQFLARSLGAKATLTMNKSGYKDKNGLYVECRDAYHIYLQGKHLNRFVRLPRKKSRLKSFNGGLSPIGRRLISIESAGSEKVRCIQVDHPNGLYITDDFIVTHNTWLLLLLALKAHKRSIIFRREFSQLRQIIDDSKKLIGEKGSFNGSTMIWRLPNSRLLEFGGVKDAGDERKYQGRAHDLKAFDELPEFTEQQFRFLIGWTRTDDPRQRCRVVAAGNPPLTAEGEWIIRFWGPWLDAQHERPARPGELRWYAMAGDKEIECENGEPIKFNGETITPKSRTFIPARIEDNPVYLESGYKATLQALPEPLRSAMLQGKFNIDKEEDPWQVIPRAWVKAAQERWKNSSRPEIAMTQLGVDCARGGKDKTVLSPLYANWFDEQKTFAGIQTPDGQSVATLIIATCAGHQPKVNIDVIGIGASAYDNVKHSVNAIPVNVAERSDWLDKSGKLKMSNQRAEMHWSFREALDPLNGKDIALPPDKELENDLCAARWELRSSGIIVESKENIVARLGRSPDKGEAAMLAWFGSYVAPPAAVVTQPKTSQFIRRGIV